MHLHTAYKYVYMLVAQFIFLGVNDEKTNHLLGLLVATSAVAEESAWFVGGQLGYSSVTHKYTDKYSTSHITTYYADTSETLNGARYGLLGGYKQFFTDKFGLRYYAALNFGNFNGVSARDYHINVDALYNFVTIDEIEIGAFGGLGLGKKTFDDPLREKWGAVVNLNLGIRANIATHHGVELFYTHDFAAASVGDSVFIGSYRSIAIEYSKPSVFGVRYTFSF